MIGLVVATCVGKAARCYAVAASILCAALAACFRSQGVLVPIAAVLMDARLARPYTSARLAVIAVSVAAALALLAAGSRFGATYSDQASAVFVTKTLFCNHLNIVLGSDAARREIVSAAGDRADATMARLAADFAAEPGRWPVLGFFGDACLFDGTLDRDFAGDTGTAVGAAKTYRRIFLAAVRDRPLDYAGKFVRQMAYGASVACPAPSHAFCRRRGRSRRVVQFGTQRNFHDARRLVFRNKWSDQCTREIARLQRWVRRVRQMSMRSSSRLLPKRSSSIQMS